MNEWFKLPEGTFSTRLLYNKDDPLLRGHFEYVKWLELLMSNLSLFYWNENNVDIIIEEQLNGGK